MAIEVIMPRLTHDMTHGVLIRWLKEDGESVKEGEPIFEVETDKAISEVVAEADGLLSGIQFKKGDEVTVGTLVAYILAKGETLPSLQNGKAVTPVSPAKPEPIGNKFIRPSNQKMHEVKDFRVIASPIARRIARDHNIDLINLTGSGPGGRIVETDVREFISSSSALIPTSNKELQETPFEKVPLTHIQRTTGDRLVRSVQSAPHFVLEVDINMTEACRLRDLFNAKNELTISYTSIFIKVAAIALQKNPAVNVSFWGDHVRRYKEVNIGVAIATPAGLLVPVIIRRMD
jgi:pyruvate dehydrogenase E2 component (dihydrolipoamide acetyltransferase)